MMWPNDYVYYVYIKMYISIYINIYIEICPSPTVQEWLYYVTRKPKWPPEKKKQQNTYRLCFLGGWVGRVLDYAVSVLEALNI